MKTLLGAMYEKLGIRKEVWEFGEEILGTLTHRFEKIGQTAEYNQLKVIHAMQANRVSEACLYASSGYGYNDLGRDTLEKVYATAFGAEDALVRSADCLRHPCAGSGPLRKSAAPGTNCFPRWESPMIRLEEVIGIRPSRGSLHEYGVTYRQVDVETMRRQIQAMGGSFRFRTQATDLILRQNRLRGLILNGEEELPAEAVILALGHSARDTFQMLYRRGICMEAKSFAAGVRVEHPQEMITRSQYGEHVPEELKAASYRLAQNLDNGRGVYSFCMCPGGWVVNASSEPGFLAVNGMSYRARGGPNANSAIVVTVTPEDYAPYNQEGLPEALSGMAFQRYLEKMAFKAARGRIPVQRFEDFCRNRQGGAGGFPPCIKGGYSYENVRNLLPNL